MTATIDAPPTPPPPPSPTPGATPAARAPGRPAEGIVPTRSQWIDIAFLGALIGLAVYGFGPAYGGTQYFVAGLVGTALGLTVAHTCARTRQPLVVVAAGVVLVFFLFGGAVAVPDRAIGGFLPSPGSVTALVDGLVQGWARLLTTVPPVGTSANLLTVPYVCGLLAAVLALTVAARTRLSLLAVVFPTIVLALSILFGTSEPASLLFQGAVFGAVAVGWVSIRHRNDRRVSVQGRRSRRWIGAVGMLLAAGIASAAFGDALPGADTNDRLVLRDRMQPPFDPQDYPSPLNGFRKYVAPELLRDAELFTVTGLEAGELVRLATLDTYDGVVYTVASGAGSSGYFRRVGDRIPVDGSGRRRTVTIEVGEYQDVWLPTFGDVESVEFLSERSAELRDSLRYNLQTGTAAVQSLLQEGDRYRLEVFDPDVDAEVAASAPAASVSQPRTVSIESVQQRGTEFAGDAAAAKGRIDAILAKIWEIGARSDGGAEEAYSLPGHYAQRLASMVDPNGAMVGNAEQYAPLVALMGQAAGVPTRVVMGARIPEGGQSEAITVKGEDVTAWIEFAVEGVGWVRPDKDVVPDNTTPKAIPEPKPEPQSAAPPPPPPPIPTNEEDETDPNKVEGCQDKPDECPEPPGPPGGIPAWIYYAGGGILTPGAVVGAFTGIVAAMKSRRRKRRRTTGNATERVAGGWDEVTDLACDLGSPVPPLATRREAGSLIGAGQVVGLARSADGLIFGPGHPGDEQVESYWSEVDGAREAMVADRTRFERWKALVSFASLRANRHRRRAERAAIRATGAHPRLRRATRAARLRQENPPIPIQEEVPR